MEVTMNRARHGKRGIRAVLAVTVTGLLATTALTAARTSAHAAAPTTSQAANACSQRVFAQGHVGRFGGILRALPVRARCQTHFTGDTANGTPPLIFHGGPVMGTPSTGPVVVTPIFWNASAYPIASSYKNILNTYLGDVVAASGQHSNVYSTL